MAMGIETIFLIINVLLISYLLLLWGSLDKVNIWDVLKEPALYIQPFKISLTTIPLAIFIPWVYVSVIYFFCGIIGLFLGVSSNGFYTLLTTAFAVPLIIFATRYYQSTFKTLCKVCNGKGKVDGYNEYLEIHFNHGDCFCCKGKGTIHAKDEINKTHDLLLENLLKEEEAIKKVEVLEKEQEELSQNIERKNIDGTVKNNLEGILSKINSQIEFEQAAKNFYRTAVEKLMILLYNKHLAEYILGKTKEFDEIEEQNISTYADTESKKYQLSDTEIVDKIEALVQEIALRQNLSIVQELQKELETSTEKLQIK